MKIQLQNKAQKFPHHLFAKWIIVILFLMSIWGSTIEWVLAEASSGDYLPTPSLTSTPIFKTTHSAYPTTHQILSPTVAVPSSTVISREALSFTTFLTFISSISLPVGTDTFYYVSPSGSDLNSGSYYQPWKTIQKAASTMVGGDTVFIRGGTYNERVSLVNQDNSKGPYITFTNYPNETVILDGTGINIQYGEGLFNVWNTDYIRVSGLNIQKSNGAGLYVAYSNHIWIDNNRTYDTVKSGIGIWGGTNVLVDSNVIALACNSHPNYPASEENITISAGSYNVEVKNNLVHQAANIPDGYSGGEGINIKDGSHDIQVHHNVVHLDERTDGKPSNRLAFGLDGWSHETYNISFFSNIAYNNANGFVIESEAGATVRDITVYNNIAYKNNRAGFLIPNWAQNESSLKKNIYFTNNTAYKNGSGININSIKIENIVIKNNILYLNGTSIQVGSSVPQAQIVSDHNLTNQDPKFVNPSGGNFHLQSGSPAIDTGSSLNAPTSDFDGNLRPQGAGFDIGAFEY